MNNPIHIILFRLVHQAVILPVMSASGFLITFSKIDPAVFFMPESGFFIFSFMPVRGFLIFDRIEPVFFFSLSRKLMSVLMRLFLNRIAGSGMLPPP